MSHRWRVCCQYITSDALPHYSEGNFFTQYFYLYTNSAFCFLHFRMCQTISWSWGIILNSWGYNNSVKFNSVRLLSCVRLFATPWISARQAFPSSLPEFTQTWVHRVSDAMQPSHPLSSPSPAPNPSQHQSLFYWVNSLHEVAKVVAYFKWTAY